jgi:hypothetical protein
MPWTNGGPNERVLLKGIHRVEARLANGAKRVCFYAWRNGPRIRAEPGTAAFISEYHEAHASIRRPRTGTLDDRRIRGEFKSWRDRFANTPREADYAWPALSRIFSFSKGRGLIATNPCEGGGRLYSVNRTDKIWTDFSRKRAG